MPKFYSNYEETHYTERTATQRITETINSIIQEKSLRLGVALTEIALPDGRQPDILIRDKYSNNPICVIEIKPPYWDALRIEDPVEPAYKKAHQAKAPFFATSNINTLILFSTERARCNEPIPSQIVERMELLDITRMEDIERPENQIKLKKCLDKFLTNLIEYSTGKKPAPKIPIDEFLILELQSTIKCLQEHYYELIREKAIKDPQFSKELQSWFIEQGWSFAFQETDYEKAAYQASYLLVNKILFYTALQEKLNLPNLTIPEDLSDGGMLKGYLEVYFNKVLEIDYETIFSTDFIDKIAFPTQVGAINKVKELLQIINRYQVSKIGYDIIGRIFEKLIPISERHKLGQYFTKSDIVDLILKFCTKSEKDIILDPACGAGTFLVRAYQHKILSNPMLEHEEILNMLWGVDIAKFPAHLSTINLAINNLESLQNYPCIVNKDFFDIQPTSPLVIKGLGRDAIEKVAPNTFDCIVGNPPYTRQEEMEDIQGARGYKAGLIEKATKMDDKGIIKITGEISKRAGIHTYFFIHGTKFLKEGGRFGFIVSNSWLDVGYGKGLQEFFLTNYKIIAIIESKVERWFEDADINTCIIILEKCNNEQKRSQNSVRFAYLKKPLNEFIPPAENMWEKQVERLEKIDQLVRLILGHYDFYENEDIRIFPKKQSELLGEGFDSIENKYIGAKWGKYLRAPEIFFKILEKGKDKLVPLKNIADVRFGIKTGADPWFYVKDITDTVNFKTLLSLAKKAGYHDSINNLRYIQSGDGTKWLIEREYIKPVIRNPINYKSIFIDDKDLKDFVIYINEPEKKIKDKLIGKYIEYGEQKVYTMGKSRNLIPAQTETCSSRPYWYQLPSILPAKLLWQKAFDIYYRHFLISNPTLANQRFYLIYPNNNEDTKVIAAILNSTLIAMYLEFQRTIMGLGAIEATVEEVKQIFVISPKTMPSVLKTSLCKAFDSLKNREIASIFEELGANSIQDVSLNTIKPDRRQLDQIIMGEILGLSEEEQLEVYKAVIDLVKSRIEKAKSVIRKGTKSKGGININELVKSVLENTGENNLQNFYKNKILSKKTYEISISSSKKEPRIDNTLTGWVIIFDKKQIDCSCEELARYLKVFAEIGLERVATPFDEEYIKQIIEELEQIKSKTESIINEFTYAIADKKLKNLITRMIWLNITNTINSMAVKTNN